MKKYVVNGAVGMAALISIAIGCSNSVRNLTVGSETPPGQTCDPSAPGSGCFNATATMEPLSDINPSGYGDPSGITLFGTGKILFYGTNGTQGYELWISDGTAAGTTMVKDIVAGASNSYPSVYTILKGSSPLTAVFNVTNGADSSLWKTDGTDAGTVLVKNINPGATDSISDLKALENGKVLFAATDGVTGKELWITDGTTAGTTLLADLNSADSGAGSSYPNGYSAIGNGEYLFAAITGGTAAGSYANGVRQIYKTDGATVTPIKTDFTDSCSLLGIPIFGVFGSGKRIFAQCSSTIGYEPWITDGTNAGTVLLKDINTGASGSTPNAFASLSDGRVVFFAATSTQGSEMWVSDGTNAGTVLLKEFRPGNGSGGAGTMVDLQDGRLLFMATDVANNYEPWITDGTPEGTRLLKEINPATSSLSYITFTVIKPGVAVFWANDGVHGIEPWITDGTTEGTRLLLDTVAGSDTAIWAPDRSPVLISPTKLVFSGCPGTVNTATPNCKELHTLNLTYELAN